MVENKKCPECNSNFVRPSKIGKAWCLKCWKCMRYFTKDLEFVIERPVKSQIGKNK